MIIRYKKSFSKDFKKLPPSVKLRFKERLELFKTNPFHPQLHNHQLHAQYKGLCSINITGDYRLLFEQIDEDEVLIILLFRIGTHSQLYI